MMSPAPRVPGPPCTGCDTGNNRREFVGERAAIAAGVAGALGISPGRAAALSIDLAHGLSVRGDEVAYGIPAPDEVVIDKDHEVILARSEQTVFAFGLSCPHEKTPLRWQEGLHRFQCPKHKSRFQLTGAFEEGRATRSMDRYRIRREADKVVVDTGKLYREDQNRDEWIAAVVRL